MIKNSGFCALDVFTGNTQDGDQVEAILVNALRHWQAVIRAGAGDPDLMHTINGMRRIKTEKAVYLPEQGMKFRQIHLGWFNFSKLPQDVATEVIDRAGLDKVIMG